MSTAVANQGAKFEITDTKLYVPVVTLSTPVVTFYNQYFLPAVEIKDCNAMINGKNFFNHPMKICKRTYDNIWKIETGQGYDYNY